MHNFIPPFPSLRRQRQTSDSSSLSHPSSRTTSPPSSPTTSFRPFSRESQSPNNLNLFNLSFHPHNTTTLNSKGETEQLADTDTLNHNDTSGHNHAHTHTHSHGHPHCGMSILPGAVLRGRSTMMLLRRRPSAIDLALSEERSRCTCDSIERQGLDLMEPRPVDIDMDMNMAQRPGPGPASIFAPRERERERESVFDLQSQQQPRFVMGGIFEVMEGSA